MNLPGTYRKLVVFPWDLSFRYVGEERTRTEDSYSAGSDHCTATEDSSCVDSDSDAKRPRLASSSEVCRRSEGCCSILEISFSLEPSCYATSCLRELMKN